MKTPVSRFLFASGFDRAQRAYFRFGATLLLITLVGLALRCIHIMHMYYTTPSHTIPSYGELYMRWIKTGIATEAMHDLLARNPPGYFLVVGAIRELFGMENFRLILYVQAFVDSLTIILMGIASRYLYGARAGILAAMMYALYSIAILYTGQIANETFTIFWMMMSVVSFLRYLEHPSWQKALLAGLLLAIAAHFRLNVITLIAAFGVYSLVAVWKKRASGRQSKLLAILKDPVLFRYPLILIGTTLLAITPVSIKNSIITGRPVLICGADSERVLQGANPNSLGEGDRPFPESWLKRFPFDPFDVMLNRQQRREKAKIEHELMNEFIWETHPAYYWFTIVPNKFRALLSNEHVLFVGRGPGASMELPFGPRIRVPLVPSWLLVTLGLLGLLLPGRRYTGFTAVAWLILFGTVQLLTVEVRYRLLSEIMLLLACSAILVRLFFATHFQRRLAYASGSLALIAFAWSGVAWARFSGKNLIADPAVLAQQPTLDQAVNDRLVVERLDPKTAAVPYTVQIGEFPIDSGRCSHVAFYFDYWLKRTKEAENDYRAGGYIWPELQTWYGEYDDTGTTLAVSKLQFPDLNDFHTFGGTQWRVAQLHGRTRNLRIWMTTERPGTVCLYNLQARGGVWYDNTSAVHQWERARKERTNGS